MRRRLALSFRACSFCWSGLWYPSMARPASRRLEDGRRGAARRLRQTGGGRGRAPRGGALRLRARPLEAGRRHHPRPLRARSPARPSRGPASGSGPRLGSRAPICIRIPGSWVPLETQPGALHQPNLRLLQLRQGLAAMGCQAPVTQAALLCGINQTRIERTPGSRLSSEFACSLQTTRFPSSFLCPALGGIGRGSFLGINLPLVSKLRLAKPTRSQGGWVWGSVLAHRPHP